MEEEPTITVETSGTTPVVLLHGVGLDHTMWEPFQTQIGRATIALDLPGHGAQPPLREPQTLADLAEDILRRLPRGAVHLVGFSLGALIAQHIARFHPERIATISCVSTVCCRTPAEAAAVSSRLATAATDFPASIAASLLRWYPANAGVPNAVIEATEQVLLTNDHTSYLHAYAVFAEADQQIAPELGRITAPTLAITGELDTGSTPEMSRRLADAVPNARVIIVPGARHMLPVENAPALAQAVTTFIDETERTES
jgi:pimeloyl-ACP methyl ester carboxylesterase